MDCSVYEIADGINLNCFPCDKNEKSFLSVNVLSQLSRETVSLNAVLPFVLMKGCFNHPDDDALKAAADAAGGMVIVPFSRKYGEIQAVGIQAEFSEKFIKQAVALVCELISNPATRGGLLLPDHVSSVCEELAEKVSDYEPDSIRRCLEGMCAYEDYAVSPEGETEEIQSINYKKLSKYYRNLLQTAPVEIIYIGPANEKQLVNEFKRGLNTLARTDIDYEMGTDIRSNSVEENPRHSISASSDGAERATLGYRLGEDSSDADPAVSQLMLKLAEIKLRKNYKDELTSLNIFSDPLKGVFAVSASPLKFDQKSFEDIFADILSAIAKEEFSPDELIEAKNELQQYYSRIAEVPEQLCGYVISSILSGHEPDIDDTIGSAVSAPPEKIAASAAGAVLDMIFEEKTDF